MPSKKPLKPSFNKKADGTLKTVIFDLETSHISMVDFSLFGEKSGNPKNLLTDWYIISASWKMLGADEVHAVSVLDDMKTFKKDSTNDYVVVKRMHEVLSDADIIIGHNIDAFDWKKLNTRFLLHGLAPLARARSVDTYKIAKRDFAFTSNKLDYIASKLGVGSKMETPAGLWMAAFRGDENAIKIMVEYNKQDVVITEKVYLALRPYDTSHANLSTADHNGTCTCPKCTSESMQKRGFSYTNAGKFQRYQCTDCGGWARGRENLLTAKNNNGIKPDFLTNK